MARIRFIMASLGAAVAAASATTLAVSASAAPAPVTAHVWVTTPDGTDKLTPMAPVSFGSATPSAPTIVVDPTLTYQRMQGFGGAITDSSATVLYRLSPAVRAATMRSLFDPVSGDGLDYLRQPIGASDFVATARWGAGHLHLARHRARQLRAAPGQPAGLVRDRQPGWPHRSVLHR
jgi:glucosylceramidase